MIKKPLVLTNGEIEQLQAGDSLSSVPNSLELVNGDIADAPVCVPVYISASNTFLHAVGENFPNAIGITSEPILMAASGIVQTDGKLSALTSDWDLMTGQIGGLTPGATYYLGLAIGLTPIPPTAGFLVRVGIAVNATDLEIKISRPIKL